MSPRATPANPAELPADEGVPVPGELVTLDAIQPTDEQVSADRSNRRSRTAGQAFSGASLVTVIVYLLRLAGIDLNPLPDAEDVPAEVAAAAGALFTYLAAVWMNRTR